MSKKKIISTSLILATVLGLTAGITMSTNKQIESMQTIDPISAETYTGGNQQVDELEQESNNLATIDSKIFNSVIGGTAINEYATYVEYQNVDGSHEIRAWGYNDYGLLGNGDENTSTKLGYAEATKVDLDMTGKTLKFMESYDDTIFVVLEDNAGGADEIWAWGNNDKGQLFIDPSISYVSTPTRILEDKIPTWGSIVGIDASVGSSIIYFQGTEGQEYDPSNYNDESLWMYGAGDTSKDQDAKLGMFETPVRFYSTHYIDSDANSQAYTMVYKLTSDVNWQDSRVISWGDNSNYILGTGDNLQPEDGYFVPEIHDAGFMPSFGYYQDDVTVIEKVTAGENNFVYQAQSTFIDDFGSGMPFDDLVYATGSKQFDGESGYYSGLEHMSAIDIHGFGSSYTGPDSQYYSYGDFVVGPDYIGYIDRYMRDQYSTAENEIKLIGSDVDEETIPKFIDQTAVWNEGLVPVDEYQVNEITTDIDTFLDGNSGTMIWAISSDDVFEKRYEIIAGGSNSNGIFDEYSDSNETEQNSAFTFGTDSYNYENIELSIVEGSIHSTSVEFTVDTSKDSGMINPNSYELNIKANGEDWTDNLELISLENGVATYKANNLLRDTEYNFEYSFNESDEVFHNAFSFKTNDKVAPAPVIKSVEFVPTTELDSYDEWLDDSQWNSYEELINNGINLYSIEAKWEIEDLSEINGEQTTLEKITFVADKTSKEGVIQEDFELFEVLNPEWKGESSNYLTLLEDNYIYDPSYPITIFPGDSLTNVRMELYANQSTTPITYEMPDYTQPDLKEIDKLYDLQVTGKSNDYNPALYYVSIDSNIISYGDDTTYWPTHVENDIEFTNFEIVSIDDRISSDDIKITHQDKIYGSIDLTMSNLTPSTTYDDFVVKIDWIDHLTGAEYTQTIDLINDCGLDFTTTDWLAPNVPTVTFNEVSTTSTSSTFNWIITTEEPSSTSQSPTQINKVEIREKTTGKTYDVTEDMIDSGDIHSGVSTVEGLTPETMYKFDLVVNYSDVSGGNTSSVVTPIITVNTGDYLEALQPIIKIEEGTPGYDSITVDYSIELPSPIDNPENRPTELYSVKLYINDETTPAAVSQEGDLLDTNGDGQITGSLTASELEPETSYEWHIEVESNADLIIGDKHEITTTMLSEPNAPFIVEDSLTLTPTEDYNTFKFDYKLNTIDEAVGQSPAFINSVEFIYKGKTIGEQSFKSGSSPVGGQPIPEEGFVGSFNVTGLQWNEADITDAKLKVGYSGSSSTQNYTTEIDIVGLDTPSFETSDSKPSIQYASVAKVGGFSQISSNEAVITYAVKTPAVTLGTAAVQIDEIRFLDGTDLLATTTEHSGSILLTGLTADTLYTTLKIEVDYSYVRPSYDQNAGEFISEGATVSRSVTPFKTLAEDEFQLAGNLQYVGYENNQLETQLNIFDSSNVFIPGNFRVSVMEGSGSSAVRVEKNVQVTKIEETKSEKNDSGIETSSYKVVISDIQEGTQYTSWKYTMSTMSHPEDSEWISFIVEDPLTGNEFNQFFTPANITNHNFIYIIIDIILLIVSFGLIGIIVKKKANGDDEEEEVEVKATKTKSSKGGK